MPGGAARTQWLTTLTGESPTSLRSALAAGRIRRTHKARPKGSADAAARRSPPRTPPPWGWQHLPEYRHKWPGKGVPTEEAMPCLNHESS